MTTSFRDVVFNVISFETKIGRRNTLHAVPFEDTGARANDVGRAPRHFSFTAVIIGVDYRTRRDKLIEALETKGPGLLSHPEIGRLLCYGDDRVRVSERTTALNRVEFDFTLVEAADQQPQRAQYAPLASVKSHKLAGLQSAADTFARKLNKPPLSDFVAAARLDVLDKALSDLRAINGAIGTALSVPSAYAAQIDQISANAALLLATPRRLFQSISAVVENIAQGLTRVVGPAGLEGDATEAAEFFGTPSRTSDGISSLRVAAVSSALIGSSTSAVPSTDTPERNQQRDDQDAIITAVRSTMLLELADTVTDIPVDSRKDAIALRTVLVQSMVDIANADPTAVDLSDALRGSAAGISRYFRELEREFTTYTPGQPLPAEVIAYIVHGDPERADEIVNRNGPSDPGACDARVPLEVRRD